MRQIVFDTETTGLDHAQGHRIIEIGAVEIISRRRTGRFFHRYCKPDRVVDAGALAVHGITNEFLSTQPTFDQLMHELLEFMHGAELIIHNAAFDIGFLEAEFKRYGHTQPVRSFCQVFDTLSHARKLHPGQRNTLDALCKRYSVDNSGRDLHGALLDANLLLDVYLAMTGGQEKLTLDESAAASAAAQRAWVRPKGELKVLTASADELALHDQVLTTLDKASGGKTLWRRLLS